MAPTDSRSLSELFATATDWSQADGEGDWTAVSALHWLGTREVLNRALEMTSSRDPRERARGADILGQLGIPDRTFPDECLNALVKLIDENSDANVLESAVFALGHLRDASGIEALLRLVNNTDGDVRHGVAFALGLSADPRAVAALIRLTGDSDAHVRDWATFGLGAGEVNTPEVREALHERLSDPDEDTQFEAVCGLARCRDTRAAPLLSEWLGESPDNSFLLEAARQLLGMDDRDDTVSVDGLISGLRALANG